jgi:hypothetical protein
MTQGVENEKETEKDFLRGAHTVRSGRGGIILVRAADRVAAWRGE